MEISWGKGKIKAARFHWLNIGFALVFLGCSTTTVIRPGQELFIEGPASLITKDGKRLKVRQTRIQEDSVSTLDSRTDRTIRLPMIEARKLVVTQRGRGAWQGMLIFSGVAAAIGAIPDPDCGDPCLFPNGGVGGSLFWAVAAAPAGALWGAILGSHRNYVFEPSPPIPDSVP